MQHKEWLFKGSSIIEKGKKNTPWPLETQSCWDTCYSWMSCSQPRGQWGMEAGWWKLLGFSSKEDWVQVPHPAPVKYYHQAEERAVKKCRLKPKEGEQKHSGCDLAQLSLLLLWLGFCHTLCNCKTNQCHKLKAVGQTNDFPTSRWFTAAAASASTLGVRGHPVHSHNSGTSHQLMDSWRQTKSKVAFTSSQIGRWKAQTELKTEEEEAFTKLHWYLCWNQTDTQSVHIHNWV